MGFTNRLPLDKLSMGTELVEFLVEEHVMASYANGWKDGRKTWSIEHDAGQGIMHIAAEGDLPPQYAEIRDRLISEQEAEGKKPDVDYVIEIPVEVARSLTGFRYDEDIPGTTAEDDPIEKLQAVKGGPMDSWKPGGCFGIFTFGAFALCAAYVAACLLL